MSNSSIINSNFSIARTSPAMPFLRFLFSERKNRNYLIIWLTVSIAQFGILKYYYPFPDFSTDGDSYIFAADNNLTVNIWPIGYSKFLQLFHSFSHSSTALVISQYIILELSLVYFFFTILYFYSLRSRITRFLFIFLAFNPLITYLANYIGSDGLFTSLTIAWFTQLIWLINKPRLRHLTSASALVFLCMTVRNNAYFYPLVTIIAFLMARKPLWYKVTGIILPFILIIPFILFTRNEAYKLTGTRQYSFLTGWQLANNALYMYDKIIVNDSSMPTRGTKELNKICTTFFEKSDSWQRHKNEVSEHDGNFFTQYINSPLKKYMRIHYPTDNQQEIITAWAKSSVVFESFGSTLIKEHPYNYIKYYLFLNLKKYFLPQLEKLGQYNRGLNKMNPESQDWFDYRTSSLYVANPAIQRNILYVFQPIFCLVNLFSILIFISYMISIKFSHREFNRTILLFSSFSALNGLFSIFTAINVLRYQIFPMVGCLTLFLLLRDVLKTRETLKIALNDKINKSDLKLKTVDL